MSNHDVECPGCLRDCRNMACICHSESSGAMETPTGPENQQTGVTASGSIPVLSANQTEIAELGNQALEVAKMLAAGACICHHTMDFLGGKAAPCYAHTHLGKLAFLLGKLVGKSISPTRDG